MGIYDRDYMREGYQPANGGKKKAKRKRRFSLPLLAGAVALLGLVAVAVVLSVKASDESETVMRVEYPLDLNTATFEELLTVPQIGPATAEQILNQRPFEKLEELLTIYGVGESKLKVFSEYLTVNPADIELILE